MINPKVLSPGAAFDLLKATFKDWNEDKASRLAAALAYYTAFSIAPLVLLCIVVAGVVFGQEAAQGAVFAQLQGLLGSEAAGAVETAVRNSQDNRSSVISAIIGLATLAWSASNVFSQLQEALNTIWEVQPKPSGIVGTVKRRIVPLSMVVGIGFLLLVSLVLSAGLSAVGKFLSGILPGSEVLWQVVNFVVSFGVVTLLFAAIYKVLPDAEISWSDVWVGGAVTALLFVVGKLLIGLYLGQASVGSTYGAAGSLLVFLVWVYYSAQILFFGAEFTQNYARRYGTRIVPEEHAVPLTEEARSQQGMPRKEAVERAARTGEPVATAAQALQADGGSASSPDDRVPAAATKHDSAQAGKNGHDTRNGHDSRNGHDARNSHDQATAYDSGVVKKLLWMGLFSGTLAAAGLAARRTSAALWGAIMHEPPPTSKV